MSKTKRICPLCESAPTEDWTCHYHVGEMARIDYLGGRIFEWHLFFDGEQIYTVTAEECPRCGRDLY